MRYRCHIAIREIPWRPGETRWAVYLFKGAPKPCAWVRTRSQAFAIAKRWYR